MKLKFLTHIAAAFALVLTAGCIPETDTYLSDPKTSTFDTRLIGEWYSNRGKSIRVVAFRKVADKNANVYEMIMTNIDLNDGKEKAQTIRGRVWTTRIGDHYYLNWPPNAKQQGKTGRSTGLILHYTIEKDGTVRFAIVDDDKLRQAIKARALHARIRIVKSNYVKERLVITSPRQELVSFLREKGPRALFGEPVEIMHRMKRGKVIEGEYTVRN